MLVVVVVVVVVEVVLACDSVPPNSLRQDVLRRNSESVGVQVGHLQGRSSLRLAVGVRGVGVVGVETSRSGVLHLRLHRRRVRLVVDHLHVGECKLSDVDADQISL